jgi:hypothetical protein
MTGEQMKEIRKMVGLGRASFALLLGYTGSDRNNDLRVRRLEAEEQVPLYIGRLVWMIMKHYHRTGKLPIWPDHLHIEGESEPWM